MARKAKTNDDDRDNNGRFKPGHPGGPGRPRRAIETDYLAALSEALPMDRWKRVVDRAVSDAENGDAKAREWLAIYLMGRPTGNSLRKLAIDEGSIEATLLDLMNL